VSPYLVWQSAIFNLIFDLSHGFAEEKSEKNIFSLSQPTKSGKK